jgi:hypothetical protein
VSNFHHHYNRAAVEKEPETVLARKLFFQAEALRLKGSPTQALRAYEGDADHEGALKIWRDKVLLKNKEFRRDSFIQEGTFESQLKYVDLYTELNGNAFKAQVAHLLLVPMRVGESAGACPTGLLDWIQRAGVVKAGKGEARANWVNPLLGGPFDVVDDEGQPLIDQDSRLAVLRRLYPSSYKSEPPPGMQGGRPTPPQGR